MDYLHQVVPWLTGTEKAALAAYLDSGGWLTEFQQTRKFEELLAAFNGAEHCLVVTSGTAALYLALLALGIGPGDGVVVPNYTMIATVNAVRWTGAEPILVDISPETMCLDLAGMPPHVHAKAMIYVPINGRCGDMEAVCGYCRERGWVLMEDACQALGSTWRGKKLGTWGDLGVYSFTPHKIITTGQGGAIVTNHAGWAQKIRKLKDFHRTAPATDEHDGLGFNFKFTDLQAVVGIEQMKTIEDRRARKKELYAAYASRLQALEEVRLLPTDLQEVTPWFMDILVAKAAHREGLRAHLKDHGIDSRPCYPAVNRQVLYAEKWPRGTFPVSEDMAERGLWLPSSLGLTAAEVERVCDAVEGYFRRQA